MYPCTYNEIEGIFVHQQVEELLKQGCEVKVFSPLPLTPFLIKYIKKKWRQYSENPFKVIRDGIEVFYPRYVSLPKSLLIEYSGYFMYQGIKQPVNDLYNEFPFDLIHAHVALPDGFAGMILKKKYGKPLVVTIHGNDLQTTLFKNQKCKKAIKQVLKNADRVIVVSNKLKNIAQSKIGIEKKITVINNGLDLKKLLIEKSPVFCKSDCKTILSVSDLILSKGIDLNLKAFAQLAKKHSQLKYTIIGDGPEMSHLKRLASRLNLNKNVTFVGQLPHEEVFSYMKSSDIFSLPSWKEGFGIVYLEAMAHGKPVIAVRGEGIEDVVKHGETGLLVKPQDVDSLIEAMEYLLSHPEDARVMGERGSRLVLEQYTWEKNAEKTMDIYNEVLNNSNAKAVSGF